jgi:release factor glutamine methyltransferase
MARSIAKGPKPRAGYATIDKKAPKPFAKAPRPERNLVPKAKGDANEPLGTVQVALLRAQKHGIAKIDARILLLHTLGKTAAGSAWLLANDNNPINAVQADAFNDLCARRRAGEPVGYIVGHKEFYGLRLAVDKRVLDPRADTETLADWALEILYNQPTASKLLDLGTGSGAIALAIQSKRADVQVHASDASADALAVAQANAKTHQLPVQFHQGSWCAAVAGQAFDVIVSNPPYIEAADPHLAALTHEPLSALASGADGLDDIRQIIAQAAQHLNAQGWLILEHGYNQAEAVRALLQAAGFSSVESRKDLAEIERCTAGQWQA